MPKKHYNQAPSPSKQSASSNPSGNSNTPYIQRQQVSLHEGPIPDPLTLERYEQILPGAAERILAMAEGENEHRHRIEDQCVKADIEAREKQIQIHEKQVSATASMAKTGQFAGITISLGSIIGAVILGLSGHTELAAALILIPSASLIKAFFFESKK